MATELPPSLERQLDRNAGLIAAAQPKIQRHEGYEFKVYRDTKGIPTIAVGFNLLRPDAKDICSGCGADYEALLSGQAILTAAQVDWIYRELAIDALEWLTKLFPMFFSYSENRQIALLDMAFNLGPTRFAKFRLMISAILAGNWPGAAQEALHSEWAGQVGERAAEDAGWLVRG